MSDVASATETRQKLRMPKLWRVIVHDDESSPAPIPFFMKMLIEVFHKDPGEAKRIAETISVKKKGQVGVYVREIAAQKVSDGGLFAAQHRQPGVKITHEPT